MNPVIFEGFNESIARLPQLLKSIPDILRNPAANPLQAAVLLGIGLVLVLIVVISVLLVFMRPSAEEEALLREGTDEGSDEVEWVTEEEQAALDKEEAANRRTAALTITSVTILLVAVVWLVGGYTTSQPEVCTSCHPNTSHSAASQDDPHRKVKCVACHEGGGALARISINVFTRVEHVVFSQMGNSKAAAFGTPVASDGCLACHRKAIKDTVYDPVLRLKTAHAQPLAAGAECVDCHAMRLGVVNAATVGMAPCLRCHDGKNARVECSVCHDGDPSLAIRPSVALNAMAGAQVPNPQCSGCHFDQTSCDNCHGISMPHSVTFKAYAHARDAALDIWYNDGKMCVKCHYPGRRGCVRDGCHAFSPALGHPNPSWAKMHALTPWNNTAPLTACSCHQWNPYDHDGMIYCMICHPTKPRNARR